MIKTELENDIAVIEDTTNPYLFIGSLVVVICGIILISFLAAKANNIPKTAPHSDVSNVSALPLANPNVSSLSGTGSSSSSNSISTKSNAGSLAAQSYDLQNNVPTAGKVKQPTTNSLQTSGPSSGQSINTNYPF